VLGNLFEQLLHHSLSVKGGGAIRGLVEPREGKGNLVAAGETLKKAPAEGVPGMHENARRGVLMRRGATQEAYPDRGVAQYRAAPNGLLV